MDNAPCARVLHITFLYHMNALKHDPPQYNKGKMHYDEVQLIQIGLNLFRPCTVVSFCNVLHDIVRRKVLPVQTISSVKIYKAQIVTWRFIAQPTMQS